VLGIEWPAIGPVADRVPSPFLGLFAAIVAGLAERLKVARIKEQNHVAPVRLDVVGDRCEHHATALLAAST
jgi:hypothetical protein